MNQEEVQDAIVRDQILVEGYKSKLSDGYALAVLPILFTSFQDRVNALSVTDLSELSPAKLRSLVRLVAKDAASIEEKKRKELFAQLEELAAAQVLFAKNLTETGGRISGGSALNEAEDKPVGSGAMMDDILAAWASTYAEKTSMAIRRGHLEAKSPSELLSEVRGSKRNRYRDGLMAQIERNIRTSVSTVAQHVAVVALSLVFSRAGKYYRWVSVLDGHTSYICRALAGQVYEFGAGPLPPQHPNCRSSIMPLNDKNAKRLSRPTYYEWLQTQPDEFQDRVLGKSRARLFRDGGISLTEFTRLQLGKNFKQITLEELRREVPEAFKRAGI